MPEHDTYDLDSTFARLAQDIAGVSSPRGASLAVSIARRRRRTTIGATVAGLALVVGAAALGQGAVSHQSTSPASLPGPATFDAAALSAATTGWTSDWAVPTRADEKSLNLDDPQCVDQSTGGTTVEPARNGSPLFVTPAGEVAFGAVAGWDSTHAAVSASTYTEAATFVDRCAKASPQATYSYDGAQGRSWTISSGSQTQHLWIAQEGAAFVMLWVGGPAGGVPSSVDQRVMDALVAGMQSPGTYNDTGGLISGSTSGSASSSVSPEGPSENQLRRAFGDWPSGLTTGGGVAQGMPSTPCAPDFPLTSGSSMSLGSSGVEADFDFDTAAAATRALGRLVDQWQRCTATDYTVTTVDVPGKGTVYVASSAGPKAATNWAVQEGRYVMTVSIDGGSNPPASVSAAVGTLLVDAAAHPPAISHATVSPQKLKEANVPTASSSTAAPRR